MPELPPARLAGSLTDAEHRADLCDLGDEIAFRARAGEMIGFIGLVVRSDGQILSFQAGKFYSEYTHDGLLQLADHVRSKVAN